MAGDLLTDEVDARGRDGVEVPVYFNGEIVGTRLLYSDRLLLARLRALRPDLYRGC